MAKPKPAAKAKKKAPPKKKPFVADPALFAPLTEGERAGALRALLDDERLREVARVGRYRVIAVEPLVVKPGSAALRPPDGKAVGSPPKPPDPLAGRRLARPILFDYAGDRSVDACVDLDAMTVVSVTFGTAQPMLSTEEEQHARAIASADPRIVVARDGGPVGVFHYWSRRAGDLAFRRRSAAVVFARTAPTVVAVVDLMENVVSEIVAAEAW